MKRTLIHHSELFSLFHVQTVKNIHLIMKIHGDIVNTRDLPNTISYLRQYCPNVLQTECFNELNLPFNEEVKKTELGHLFEHLLLSYICKYQYLDNQLKLIVDGKTCWNWKEEPRGTFHIYISADNNDSFLFMKACKNAIYDTEQIMVN
jgi:hypothetical protein